MADDEQFSLCWNNFNTNLSAGFHESLCRGDLVDVSLAAEGHIVKAHRLVLSVCSPFFRKMFTQMPSNTHAIVFLNNVSHSALKDLIQFMYCGEVNVKQDALPAFISTAESLQIKGLTDNDPAPQPPQEPTPPPQASPHVQQQQQQVPAQRIQRQQARAPARYKIETVEDGLDDDNKGGTTTQIVIQTSAAPAQATIVQQQQTQPQTQQIQTGTTTTATLGATNKRSAQRSSLTSTSGVVKRSKTSLSASSNIIDPLEATTETATTTSAQLVPQITVQTTVVSAGDSKLRQQHQQQQEEAEYIGLPIDLPTKSEPDYVEDAGDAAGDGETTYVEDDAYGDMRYDESYFTENEDGAAQGSGAETSANVSGNVTATTSKAVVKQSQSYSDSSYVDAGADQSNTEAQDFDEFSDMKGLIRHSLLTFNRGQRGSKLLAFNGYNYVRNRRSNLKTYWICSKKGSTKCNARVVTNVIEGVHKIVLESCNHTCFNMDRKKRLSVVGPLVKTRTKMNAKPLDGIVKTEHDEDLTLELRSLNLSMEELQQLQ
ncbi:modifier of mdg4 isoform X8 [Drosophila willistoni]|uniref:modifier of mdg4 isoform X8 n=1 Tax=Drosophila willistoni TaxID=7260 RepID=UPI000C26C437|nr:modifier of mdg4 isoform X8 [Drosophila willistoni]